MCDWRVFCVSWGSLGGWVGEQVHSLLCARFFELHGLSFEFPLKSLFLHHKSACTLHPTPPTLFCNPRYLNFEVGPRYYELEVDVTDDNVSPLTVHLVFNVTIINFNDPPLLVSPNVTGVTYRGQSVWNVWGAIHTINGGEVNAAIVE